MSIGAGYIARGAIAGIEDKRRREREDKAEERAGIEDARKQERYEYERATRPPPGDVTASRKAEAERKAAEEERKAAEERRKAALHGPGLEEKEATAKKAGIDAEHAEARAEMDDELSQMEIETKRIALENAQAADDIRKAVQGATTEAAKLEAARKVMEAENQIAGNIYNMYKRNPKAAVKLYNESPISSTTDAVGIEEYADARGMPRVKFVDAQGNTVVDKRGGEQDFSLAELETAFNSQKWKALPGGGGLYKEDTGEVKGVPKDAKKAGSIPATIQKSEYLFENLRKLPEFEGVTDEALRVEAFKIAAQTSSNNPQEQRANFFKAVLQSYVKDATTEGERAQAEAEARRLTDEFFPQAGEAGIAPGPAPAQGAPPPPPAGFVLQ